MLGLVSLLALSACSNQGPVKANCGGTLRQVNPPVVAAIAKEKRP
jgi:hypothetical protein